MSGDDFLKKIDAEEAAGRKIAEAKKNWDDEPSSGDAWKVMIYVCDGCGHKERIWNARPHVTPFGGVPCPECSDTMTHAFFGSDVHVPDYRPVKGELIFIDTPPELALISAKRTLANYAGVEGAPTAEDLALNNLSDFGGHPPHAIRLLS